MDSFFTLPTSGPRTYRGKYPARIRSVGYGVTGLHIELNDGTRLWTARVGAMPAPGHSFEAERAAAVRMTSEQYAKLCEAAELSRNGERAREIGRRALDAEVRAMVDSIPAELPIVERVTVQDMPGGLYSVVAETGAGQVPDAARIESTYAEAERQARIMAARYGVSVEDSTRAGRDALERDRERERIRRNRRAQAEGMEEIARAEQRAAIAGTVQTINLAPSWSGILPALRALIENSNSEGRRTAWAELERMAALADERNRMAERIEAAAELARGTLGGFDPASNGRAAVAAILETISGERS